MKKKPFFYYLVFVFISSIIILSGLKYYFFLQEENKRNAYDNISTLSKIKISEIVNWRKDKLSEAEFVFTNRQFKSLVQDFIKNKTDDSLLEISRWIKPLFDRSDYEDAILVINSKTAYSLIDDKTLELTAEEIEIFDETMDNKNIHLSNLYKTTSGAVFVCITIPQINPMNNELNGIFLLKIDPLVELFPLIQEKPALSKTAESFIIRRDADSILFLNKLRYRDNSGMDYRLSLDIPDLPAAKLILGHRGIYEGRDYTGTKVLTDLQKIPDSPWYLVSKINSDEIYAPLREQFIFIVSGIIALTIMSGLIIFLVWRNKKIKLLQDQLVLKKEKLIAEEKIKKLSSAVEQSPASIIITDKLGNIEYINSKFVELTGYSAEEILNKNPRILKSGKTDQIVYNQMWESITRGNQWSGEVINKKKNNDFIWQKINISPIKDENGSITHFVAVEEDITDQKHYLEALRKSEEKFAKIFEKSLVAKALVDYEKLTFIEINNSFEKLFGYKREDIIGKTSKELNLYTDVKKRSELISQLKKGVPIYNAQLEVKKKDNSKIIINSTTELIEIDGKQTLLSTSQDITERIQFIESLQKSEKKQRTLAETIELERNRLAVIIDNLPIGVGIGDPDGNTLVLNAAGLEIHGFTSRNEMHRELEKYGDLFELRTTEGKIIPLEDWPASRAIKGKFDKDREVLLISKLKKTERIVSYNSVPITDSSDNLIQIIYVIQDITERKKAEELIRESEERFRELANSMPQLVWTAKPDGTVDYYNSRANEFDGIAKSENGKWTWQPVLHPDDLKPTTEAWQSAINSKTIYEITHRVKNKHGIYKWFLSRGIPIKDENENVVKWYGTATDISIQKNIEKKLESALDNLKRTNSDLEQFAYSASHDLQEPVRMIKSYSQLIELKHQKELSEEIIEYLKYITEGAFRMQQLIDGLLKYSRLSTSGEGFEEVDCSKVLKDVLDDLKFRVEEENAKIEHTSLPVIRGDKTQIRQLFQNFIQNALKFRSAKDPVIKIFSEKRKDVWLFSIADNGIGFEEKFNEKIFVIFQRLHSRKEYSGTGIGLAICKKIIERHGGEICVESIVGEGSVFYFTIPV